MVMTPSLEQKIQEDIADVYASPFLQTSLSELLGSRKQLDDSEVYLSVLLYTIDLHFEAISARRVTRLGRKIIIAEQKCQLLEERLEGFRSDKNPSVFKISTVKEEIVDNKSRIERWKSSIEKEYRLLKEYDFFTLETGLGKKIAKYIQSARVDTAERVQEVFLSSFPEAQYYLLRMEQDIGQIFMGSIKKNIKKSILGQVNSTSDEDKDETTLRSSRRKWYVAAGVALAIAIGGIALKFNSKPVDQRKLVHQITASWIQDIKIECDPVYEPIPAVEIERGIAASKIEKGVAISQGVLTYRTKTAKRASLVIEYTTTETNILSKGKPMRVTEPIQLSTNPAKAHQYKEITVVQGEDEAKLYLLFGEQPRFFRGYEQRCLATGPEESFQQLEAMTEKVEYYFQWQNERISRTLEQLKKGVEIPTGYSYKNPQYTCRKELFAKGVDLTGYKKEKK